MRIYVGLLVGFLLGALACGDDDDHGGSARDGGLLSVAGRGVPSDGGLRFQSGSFRGLTYNVAGLPEGLSSSMPLRFTPIIGPLLNGYDEVFLQETWQTPDPNPQAPVRGYNEILVAAADHPYKTEPALQPFGNDPRRPTAQLGDGLNIFSRIPLGDTQRVAWSTCVDSASDCLALKGFSMTTATFGDDLPVHLYDLHMEAGETPEDDVARDGDIDQLIAFIADNSQDVAILMGGDFNLHTDSEPAISQLARLLSETGLTDACTKLECDHPGNIDKFLYRDGKSLSLQARSWELQDDVFVSDMGEPLSDHSALEVQFDWSEPFKD